MVTVAKTAEIVALAGSGIGTVLAVATQQVIYAAAPLTMALSLSAFNRHRLENLLSDHATSIQQLHEFDAQYSDLPTYVKAQVIEEIWAHGPIDSPNASHRIYFCRQDSRDLLITALREAEERLVFICPWLKRSAIDGALMHQFQEALRRGVSIHIGWGRLGDLRTGEYKKSNFYDALPLLQQLSRQYPNLHLKAMGTHEKVLVCDRKFATIGTHNFLTSDDRSPEREVILKTTDQNLIHLLLQSFEQATINTSIP